VDWAKQGDVLPTARAGGPDQLRAWQPSVLEEDDGTLRMWYSGHDGTTGRILEAVQPPGQPWERLGVAVDAGLAGDSDRYGVEAPCVVRLHEGYLMAYGGFDGGHSRIHLASSADGQHWTAEGPIVAGETRPLAAGGLGGTPSLLIGADQWWLFYSASVAPEHANGSVAAGNGSGGARRTVILAAVSKPGDPWDSVGPVLEPEPGEVAASHPCVLEISRTLYMFYASETEQQSNVALATSVDGQRWERRGIVLSAATEDDPDTCAVTAPCVLRLRDGSLRMWYSRRPWGDDQLAYAIGSAVFPGRWPGHG
jgi:predicted GH43/DUF377 family glycosyl hydrolase